MSLVCEISGEALSLAASSPNDAIVVTPSGHVCRKSLLLAKLTENGGMDPFVSGRPLLEDDLVELQQLRPSTSNAKPSSGLVVPPRSTGSVSQTLQQLQRDYDAVILELFDTRQLLSETRKELSLALYENDAAVRVVARLATERDQALAAVHTLETSATTAPPTGMRQQATNATEPPTKKSKTDASPSENDSSDTKLPTDDWNIMVSAWETLHANRRARQKQATKRAVTLDQVKTFVPTTLESPSFRTSGSSNGDKTALGYCANEESESPSPLLVQAGRSMPHVLVYSGTDTSWSLAHTLKTSHAVDGTAIDVSGSAAAVALVNGSVEIARGLHDAKVDTSNIVMDDTIVSVRLHPDNVHVVAATSNGAVIVARLDTCQVVARFSDPSASSYTTGVLHPDGLIYVAAKGATGDLVLWDFKSQSLSASTLSSGLDHVKVAALDCSNTGYHIAAAYESGPILIWDLRKQQLLATLNDTEAAVSVVSVKFDDAGKYLAYSGMDKNDSLVVVVVTIKDLSQTVTLQAEALNLVARPGLIWTATSIAVSVTPLKKNKPHVVVFALP